jgi:prevent-host-death family protein
MAMKTELVTTLKREATKILAELHSSKEPVLITEHGLPSAYLVDVNDYELMVERMKILEGIAKGERAILEGRTLSHADAKEKFKKWLK